MYKSFSDYTTFNKPCREKTLYICEILTRGGGRVGRKKKNVDGLLMVEREGGSKITKMLTFG